MFKRILVPLDGSALAEQILPYLKGLSSDTEAMVTLLRVAGHPVTSYRVEGLTVNATRSDDSYTHCEQYLHGIATQLTQSGLKVETRVIEGPIADVIIDYAAEMQADLVAMSTHGRTGIGRWLLGSVADRVVHGLKVPLFLIRPVEGA